jgi:tetratricopeptide (TPR) repeat protein
MRRLVVLFLLSGCVAPPPAEPAITTGSTIALGNLDAQIRHAEARGTDAAEELVPLYLLRARVRGRIADLERGEALAEAWVAAAPARAEAYRLRATVRSFVHRFTDALADLDRAEALGLPAEATAIDRAVVAQGLGEYARAVALRTPQMMARPTHRAVGALAVLEAERGEWDRAMELFDDARGRLIDVSPFPLALLEVQEARFLRDDLGDSLAARPLLEAAYARLPEDVEAAYESAVLREAEGDRAGAIARLRPIVAHSDDPEFEGELGRMLSADGQGEAGARLVAHAKQRFEEILARYPAAFADHAGHFYLGVGQDPARALALARINLAARPTPSAWHLAIDAALAAGQPAEACTFADRALAGDWTATRRAELARIAAPAYTACGR